MNTFPADIQHTTCHISYVVPEGIMRAHLQHVKTCQRW